MCSVSDAPISPKHIAETAVTLTPAPANTIQKGEPEAHHFTIDSIGSYCPNRSNAIDWLKFCNDHIKAEGGASFTCRLPK